MEEQSKLVLVQINLDKYNQPEPPPMWMAKSIIEWLIESMEQYPHMYNSHDTLASVLFFKGSDRKEPLDHCIVFEIAPACTCCVPPNTRVEIEKYYAYPPDAIPDEVLDHYNHKEELRKQGFEVVDHKVKQPL